MEYDEGKMRRAQENLAKMIRGGFLKEIARAAKQLYSAFRAEGFNRRQAFGLTKLFISPWFKKKED